MCLPRVPRLCVLAAATLGFAVPVLAGPDWVEAGDAGSTTGTAQYPVRPGGVTFISTISGGLASGVLPDFEDCYVINVVSPVSLSLSTGTADFNPVMYIFNLTLAGEALGLLANDDASEENMMPLITQFSNDGTEAQLTLPGDYMIAISGRGRFPVSRTGAIFAFDDSTEISGPDGPGGLNPLSGWSGMGETGSYMMTMTGTDFPISPAPGTGVAFGLGMLVIGRRRR